jgi:hypothetical protein
MGRRGPVCLADPIFLPPDRLLPDTAQAAFT